MTRSLIRLFFLSSVFASIAFGTVSFEPLEDIPPEILGTNVRLSPKHVLEHAVTFSSVDTLGKGEELKLRMKGAAVASRVGMPEVPVVVRRFSFPGRALGVVQLESPFMEQSTTPLRLQRTGSLRIWSKGLSPDGSQNFSGRYFPGRLFDANLSDGFLYVSFFPVQVDLQTGQVLALRSAKLQVEFPALDNVLAEPILDSSRALILTPEKLLPAAQRLGAFHLQQFSVTSEIVTLEKIRQSEPTVAETELPAGYKENGAADSRVIAYDPGKQTGYDYELAKKIIHFLQTRIARAETGRYVVLLGDGSLVPPSYYYSTKARFGVTDQCYGSKNHCLDPVLAVGRLPFSSLEETNNYISKAERWIQYAKDSPSELSLYGGKAFPGKTYIGELGTLRTLASERADWRGVRKYFRTNSGFDKRKVLDLVAGKGDSSFVYYLDHGNGNQWAVNQEYVSSTEILKAQGAGSIVNPVIVSIACTDAAFDETLTNEDLFGPRSDGKQSVGIALLKSKAGAVAFLGSSRPAAGEPIYHFDEHGNLLLTNTNYGLQILDTFFEKYRQSRGGRLGDSYLKALRAFLFENGNDLSDEDNVFSYFNVALLGDPVLALPERDQVEAASAPARSTTKLAGGSFPGDLPLFLFHGEKPLPLAFEAATELTATLLRVKDSFFGSEEERVWQRPFGIGESKVDLPKAELPEGDYFLRLENARGVPIERQVWFSVAEAG